MVDIFLQAELCFWEDWLDDIVGIDRDCVQNYYFHPTLSLHNWNSVIGSFLHDLTNMSFQESSSAVGSCGLHCKSV